MTEDDDDRGKGRSPVVLTVLGVIADVAGVAALVTAARIEWLAVLGLGAVVAGLVASILALKRQRVALAWVAAAVLVIGGGLFGYTVADRLNDGPAPTPPLSGPPASAVAPSDIATSAQTGAPSAEPSPSGSTASQPAPEGTETWFPLTAYDSVAYGNGHRSVDSITIGAEAYPDSIRGSYSSSVSSPDNRRTWLVGGKCSRLSVWVGKDAASPNDTGTGRFIVRDGDAEIGSATATMSDAAQHLEIDITGVVRLTLLDTRGSRDANNAWGSPRVSCTAPPGKAK